MIGKELALSLLRGDPPLKIGHLLNQLLLAGLDFFRGLLKRGYDLTHLVNVELLMRRRCQRLDRLNLLVYPKDTSRCCEYDGGNNHPRKYRPACTARS